MTIIEWVCLNCGDDLYTDKRSGEPEFCPFCKSTNLKKKLRKKNYLTDYLTYYLTNARFGGLF